MKNRLYPSTGAAVLVLAFGQAATALAADTLAPIPTELKPPAGNEMFLKARAEGTQNYICLQSASGIAWTFLGPQATLFSSIRWLGREIRWQIATHFLSPNPVEEDKARATWQGSADTSAVWARAIASSSDPAVVAEGAIPWLLLQAAGTRPGLDGSRGFSLTTFIQRINTAGGVAPSTGCATPEDVGRTAFVPYTTDYLFYRSASGPRP